MIHNIKEIDNNNIELEIVDADGRPVIRHPIDINDLHAQRGRAIDLGNGVHLQVEEEGGNSSAEESDDDGEEYDEEAEEEEYEMNSVSSISGDEEHVPAGYRKLSDWYDALHATRQGRQEKGTQLNSLKVRQAKDPKPSRCEVWASFCPPLDRTRTYRHLQCASLTPGAMSRRFWLPPLMYHAAATYRSPTDQGQRVLVYGGTRNIGRTIESELYEFTLLTGSWRRMEGRQFVSPGTYGHAMVVVPAQQRLVVIGGIGPGGRPLSRDVLADEFCRRRFGFLFPCRENAKAALAERAEKQAEGVAEGLECVTLCSLLRKSEKPPTIGFVPILFDMTTKTQQWRAVQTVHEMPVVLHTAVTIGGAIFVFGGVTNRLLVSAQLIRIDGESYVVSLLRPPGPSPKPRFLHSAVVYGNWIIIYGGFDVHNEPLNDTWAFDVANEHWECLDAVGAPSRGAHVACMVGSRMMIVGGFEEAFGAQQPPTNSVFELQLVPNHQGKHSWKKVPVRPGIPPMAFATASPCGDEASFLLYGGCTTAPAKRKSVRSTTARSRAHSQHQQSNRRDGTGTRLVPHKAQFGSGLHDHANEDENKDDDADVWSNLVTYGDAHILTFPVKKLSAHQGDGDAATHVNALGVEVDPDEIPENFRAFVRRQQEFLLKKNAAISTTKKKTCLAEIENMEPQLYLTPEEIELLITSSEDLCECIVEYPIKSIPSNIPDRESHIHFNGECVSLSRQIRDVLKSMKGSSVGITAAKNKRHRKRTGEKFEDHSAKKPFRRAIVVTLLRDIHRQLHKIHRLNKALRTIDWADKGGYIDAIHKMQDKSKDFGRTIKSVLEKYIERRVDSLMASVAKRKERMRLLTEEVEKDNLGLTSHRDGPDPQRERVRRAWAEGKVGDAAGHHPPQKQQHVRKQGQRSRSRHRSKSMGTGYYKDESEVTIPLLPKQRDQLARLADAVQRAAEAFGTHYRTTLLTPSTAKPPETALASHPLPPGGELLSPPQLEPTLAPPPPPPEVVVSDSLAVPLAYAYVPQSESVSPSAPVVPNSDALRQSATEVADVAKERAAEFVGAMSESSAAGTPDGFVLRLAMLRPLLECKDRVTALSALFSGIQASTPDANNLSGPSSDVKAERRYRSLAKSLAALVQRVKVCFLTRAGAKPSGTVPLPEPKQQAQPPIVRPKRAASRVWEPTVERRGTITVKKLSDGLSLPEEAGLGTMVTQEQQQQQQQQQQQPQEQPQQRHFNVAFTKLPVSASVADVPTMKASGEAPFPATISITSDMAMALAPAISSTAHTEVGDAIVPSVKDTKTIPNTVSTASGVMGELAGVVQPMHAPTGSIRLATGPSVTPEDQTAPFALGSGLTSVPLRQTKEASMPLPPQQQMISFAPGSFRLGEAPQASHVLSASAAPQGYNVDGEDDYFFFGRRYDSGAVDAAAAGEPVIIPTQSMPPEPVLVPSVRKVKISPPIGTATAAVGPSSSSARRPVTHSSVQRHHTGGASPAVEAAAVRRVHGGSSSDMFRGKLTPGEALILRRRDELRAVSSRR